eukprot:GFUD01022939.1.p1 GENE.GFUD01022939.1~~GFUD01022939.1.p1  ORF type:complete len:338 (-),score=126.06 GFUD01022939.1:113-1126(-)
MSFFNFGSSPGKAPEGSIGDFSGGSFFGGVDDKTGGSIFGGSGGETGGSVFGSSSIFRPPGDLSSTTPAKKTRTDILSLAVTKAPSSSVRVTGQLPKQPNGPTPPKTSSWGARPPTKPGMSKNQQSQSYEQLQNYPQGHHKAISHPQMYKQESTGYTSPPTIGNAQPATEGYTSSPSSGSIQTPTTGYSQPPYSGDTVAPTCIDIGHSQSLGYSQATPEIKVPAPAKQQNISSVQSSVLQEKPKVIGEDKSNEEDCDDISADALLKELLNMQKEQLTELLPELREREENSEQILDSAGLVLKDITNYGEKLSGIKQQYCSKLSQVSSFLKMIPKTEH